HSFEENDIAGDPMPLFFVRRIHEAAAIFHDKNLTSKLLDVRQRLEQRYRFRNNLFHLLPKKTHRAINPAKTFVSNAPFISFGARPKRLYDSRRISCSIDLSFSSPQGCRIVYVTFV